MAGDWIKLELSTLEKPEVLRLARLLNCSRGDALFCCLKLWAWADANLTDGRTGLEPQQLDEIMGRDGAAAALLAPEIRWLERDAEDGIIIPRFDDHHGDSAKRRAKKQKQKRGERREGRSAALTAQDRAMHGRPAGGGGAAGDRTADRMATERRQMSPPTGDRTADRMATREENITVKQTNARATPAAAPPAGGGQGGGSGAAPDTPAPPQRMDGPENGLAKGSGPPGTVERRETALDATVRRQRERIRREGMRIGALVPA